jgi:hypothetical protein
MTGVPAPRAGELRDEVPEAVEMLRCPTCLSLIFDADAKRCPSCRSKLRKRSRPTVSEWDNGIADRPLPLLEQELQARIEAETAAKFRQRRRAAKVARRIASLPPTVFDGDAVVSQADAETSARGSTTDGAPTVIDLPAEAVHDVTSKAWVAEPAVEAIAEPDPEPVVEPDPEPMVAPAPVEVPPVAEVVAPEVVEPEVVEPEVVEPDVVEPEVVEPEPVVRPAPVAAANWKRSNSVWTDRVFNTVPRRPENDAVSWPPRWKPASRVVDLTDDAHADEVDYAARGD